MLIHSLEGAAAEDPSSPRDQVGSSPAVEKVKDLSKTLQDEGVESKRTLEKFKSIGNKSLSRGLDNVS